VRLQPAAPLADLSEREWQRTVVDLARQLGWRLTYHTHDSRKSAHGFPDLVLVRERILYLELKSEGGKVSPAQQEWLDALNAADGEAYVIRPRHLSQLATILSTRGRPSDVGGLE
jgi:hypothetical protein